MREGCFADLPTCIFCLIPNISLQVLCLNSAEKTYFTHSAFSKACFRFVFALCGITSNCVYYMITYFILKVNQNKGRCWENKPQNFFRLCALRLPFLHGISAQKTEAATQPLCFMKIFL